MNKGNSCEYLFGMVARGGMDGFARLSSLRSSVELRHADFQNAGGGP